MAEKIPLERITSSNLAAVGYHDTKRILAVQFKSGDIYHYANVSPATMILFYRSGSRGAFYAKEIRGKFSGEKMTGACPDCGAHGWVGDRCEDCGRSTYQAMSRPVVVRET
jgi:hypothetical protein